MYGYLLGIWAEEMLLQENINNIILHMSHLSYKHNNDTVIDFILIQIIDQRRESVHEVRRFGSLNCWNANSNAHWNIKHVKLLLKSKL